MDGMDLLKILTRTIGNINLYVNRLCMIQRQDINYQNL
jgi:hypothetical protein